MRGALRSIPATGSSYEQGQPYQTYLSLAASPFQTACRLCGSQARLYTPHVHNLGFLRTQAERIDPRLTYVWPRDTRRDRARFEKLKEAYVKARYSKHYRITKDELDWLGEQVEELGRVVHEVCSERLAELQIRSEK